jgi:trans-aconitate methyltransferase
MDTTDVDSNADIGQARYTSHLFDRSIEMVASPSGSAVRVPADMSAWPPSTLFDAVYASAVVRHFGSAVKDALKKWEDVFYPGGPMKAVHVDIKRRRDQSNADKENCIMQKEARQQRLDQRNGRTNGRHGRHDDVSPSDLILIYRCMAMEAEDVRAYLEGCKEMAVVGERNALEEKVNSWRENVGSTS